MSEPAAHQTLGLPKPRMAAAPAKAQCRHCLDTALTCAAITVLTEHISCVDRTQANTQSLAARASNAVQTACLLHAVAMQMAHVYNHGHAVMCNVQSAAAHACRNSDHSQSTRPGCSATGSRIRVSRRVLASVSAAPSRPFPSLHIYAGLMAWDCMLAMTTHCSAYGQ